VSAALEQRYRRALRWYPRAWREANADAIVGTLLDGAEGRDAPRVGEVVNLALNGLLARFGWVEKVLPAGVRDRASSLALGFGFGVTVVMLVVQEWAPWASPQEGFLEPRMIGPFAGWGGVLYCVWVLAFIAALAGLSKTARWMLAATIPFSGALMVIWTNDPWLRPSSLGLAILGALALIAAIGRPVTSRWSYLVVLSASAYGIWWVLWGFARNVEWIWRLDPRSIWSMTVYGSGNGGTVIFVLGALAVIAIIAHRWSWLGALALLSVPWWIISFLTLAGDQPEFLLVSGPPILAVLAVIGLIVFRLRGYRLRIVRRE
jgi:hypothetical protein